MAEPSASRTAPRERRVEQRSTRHRSRFAGLAAIAVAVTAGLTACSSPPTKAQFLDRTRQSVGDLDAAISSLGIDPKVGNQLIDDLIACQYNAIRDDSDLLQDAYEHPGKADVVTQLDAKAGTCSTEFNRALETARPPAAPGTDADTDTGTDTEANAASPDPSNTEIGDASAPDASAPDTSAPATSAPDTSAP